MYQPMNYSGYPGYPTGFGPQMRSGGFPGAMGYPSPQATPQNAPTPVSAPAPGGFLVQPVTSREEALAVIADPLASGVLMPDLSHGVIYVKRFNTQTGSSDFAEFTVRQDPAAPAAASGFVTEDVFNNAVENLRAEIAALKKGGKAVRRDDAAE